MLDNNPMTMSNAARGAAVRRAILAVARLALAREALFPAIPRLSGAIGICPEQCRRHVRQLINNGVLVVHQAQGRRRQIREVRL